jgi:hypothetical protein
VKLNEECCPALNLGFSLNTFSRTTYGNLCLSEAYSIVGTQTCIRYHVP